jgi:hypothetical protein
MWQLHLGVPQHLQSKCHWWPWLLVSVGAAGDATVTMAAFGWTAPCWQQLQGLHVLQSLQQAVNAVLEVHVEL